MFLQDSGDGETILARETEKKMDESKPKIKMGDFIGFRVISTAGRSQKRMEFFINENIIGFYDDVEWNPAWVLLATMAHDCQLEITPEKVDPEDLTPAANINLATPASHEVINAVQAEAVAASESIQADGEFVTPNTSRFYRLKTASNMLFDCNGAESITGTTIIQYPGHGGKNQDFYFVQRDGPFYSIHPRHGTLSTCLGVSGESVVLKTYSSEEDQQFQLKRESGSTVTLRPKLSADMVICVPNQSQSAQVELADANGSSAQNIELQIAGAKPNHGGEWRDQRLTSHYCAKDPSHFGSGSSKICSHGDSTIQANHWSCCGSSTEDSLCDKGSAPTVSVSDAPHGGEWRDHRLTSKYCARDEKTDLGIGSSMICAHGLKIVRASHYSCCGVTEKNNGCPLFGTTASAKPTHDWLSGDDPAKVWRVGRTGADLVQFKTNSTRDGEGNKITQRVDGTYFVEGQGGNRTTAVVRAPFADISPASDRKAGIASVLMFFSSP